MNSFRIVNAFNGKVITPFGWSKEVGAAIVQYDDNGTVDHYWSIELTNSNAAKIVNTRTKLWIGVNQTGKVIQGKEESSAFYWVLKPEPDNPNQVRIFNEASNLALTPLNWSTSNDAEITVWSDEGNCHTIDHVWTLTNKPAFFKIVNAFNGKVITPRGWSKQVGAPIVQYDDNGTIDHFWYIGADRDGAPKIVNAHTKLWLGVNAAGKVIQGDEESSAFYWVLKPEPDNPNQVRIFNEASNLALTPLNWSTSNDAEITVWSDEGNCHTIDHVWTLVDSKPI